MSMRANPEQAVAVLLKRLAKATQATKTSEDAAEEIKKIQESVSDLKHLFPAVKEWEQELIDHFTNLNHCFCNFDTAKIGSVYEEINKIKSLVSQSAEDRIAIYKSGQPDEKGKNVDKARPNLSALEEKILADEDAMKNVQVSYDNLDRLELKLCLLSLSVFPENGVIKKRPLIYWWIGEGLIDNEEEGEGIFEELLKRDLIIPHRNGIFPTVSRCRLHPWIRYMLISLARNAQLFDFDSTGLPLFKTTMSRRACLVDTESSSSSRVVENISKHEKLRTIFNVNQQYLDFESEWLAGLKRLMVLQLGRWQDSPTHHNEVRSEAFLKALRTQKHLRYLSFRGISRITILPDSIAQLVCLEILDLKACHNLESLPEEIGRLKKLTHLDVSECYLLESIPKSIANLTSLQVLKGFIIGTSKKTPCRIGDLEGMKNLRRSSIHIGSEAVIQDGEFKKLGDLKKVECL